MISKWISHARCWKRPGVVHVLAELAERLAGEVVALEVAQPELELPLALVPDGVEVLEELGHVLLDPRRPVPDLPRRGHGHLALVEERPAHALHEPAGGRQRQMVGGELRRPRGVATNCIPSGEKPRGQWKSTNQKRSSSCFVNGTDFIRNHGLSRCSGFQPGYQPSRNWSTETTSAMVYAPSVCGPRPSRPCPGGTLHSGAFRRADRRPAVAGQASVDVSARSVRWIRSNRCVVDAAVGAQHVGDAVAEVERAAVEVLAAAAGLGDHQRRRRRHPTRTWRRARRRRRAGRRRRRPGTAPASRRPRAPRV